MGIASDLQPLTVILDIDGPWSTPTTSTRSPGRRLDLGCEGGAGGRHPTLAVLTGGFSEAELREAGAAKVVESIGALCKGRQLLAALAQVRER